MFFDVIIGWWLLMELEDLFFNKLYEIFDILSIIGKRDRFNLWGDERDRIFGVFLVGVDFVRGVVFVVIYFG